MSPNEIITLQMCCDQLSVKNKFNFQLNHNLFPINFKKNLLDHMRVRCSCRNGCPVCFALTFISGVGYMYHQAKLYLYDDATENLLAPEIPENGTKSNLTSNGSKLNTMDTIDSKEVEDKSPPEIVDSTKEKSSAET